MTNLDKALAERIKELQKKNSSITKEEIEKTLKRAKILNSKGGVRKLVAS